MIVPLLEFMVCNIDVRLAHSTKKELGMENVTPNMSTESVLQVLRLFIARRENNQDLTPLTPAMFMHEIHATGEPDLYELNASSMNRRLVYQQKLKQDLQRRFRTKYSGHGEKIPYAHLPNNAPEDPVQLHTTPNHTRLGRRISVNPSTVDGEILKTRYETNHETSLKGLKN
ncbi:hypothetical protein NPIL_421581 [Nephila pilipes]|uniref:Uncharacterized protein n=1 Tax=Nephila pilipes TaxID=299642 RepID=A0A8X6PSU6_NEPPI|nr:hypothetical protein NPIL_421581 [Nephila pilipes]